MSIRDNVHFPSHVNIDDFVLDFCDKDIDGWRMQEKYNITGRQYRLVVRYLKEELRVKPREYKSPQRKYIYRTEYGLYSIRKRIGNSFKYFGTFKELDEAICMRDKLVECDWNIDEVIM